jgi:GNAT superfamily N-acetyltransferase
MTISAADFRDIEIIERDAWLDLYAAAPPDAAAELGLAYALKDEAALLISRRLDTLEFNRLACLGVVSPAQPEALDEAIAAFDAVGVRNGVVQVPEGEKDLEALCKARALVPHRRVWAKFIRRPSVITAQTSLEVRTIGGEHAAAFGETVAAVYGLQPAAAAWLSALVGRPRWTCFMAFDDKTPVAAAALFAERACGWLGVAATRPAYRRRGAQSALLAARIAHATADGVRTLTTETGVPHPGEPGPSYGNIQRAGFSIAYLRPNFCRAGG